MSSTVLEGLAALLDIHRVRRAILVVDTVESVRLMQHHEDSVIDRWRRFVAEVATQALPALQGRLVKSLGDGMLLEFNDPLRVLEAAADLNRRITRYNDPLHPDAAIWLRQGGHLTDVVVDDLDIYGHGVNVAHRLATLGRGGELIVSAELRDAVFPYQHTDIEDLGLCYLKHVEGPQRAFRISPTQLPPSTGLSLAKHADERAGIAVIPPFARDASGGINTLGHVIADDLIAGLSGIASLRVVSRLSSARFERHHDIDEIAGRSLGVQYVVRGNFAVTSSRVRLFLTLAEVRSSQIIWAGEFDTTVSALVSGEGAAAAEAVSAVCRALVACEVRRERETPLHNLESYTILFAAISLMHRLTRSDFQRAGDLLRYVVSRHPAATTPRAWLGKWHVLRVAQGYSESPEADARDALAVVGQALDLDSTHSLALAVDGLVCAYIRKDLATAGRRYEAALSSNPNEGLALLFQASWHAYQERGDAAVDCAVRARRLSPLDPLLYYYDNFACLAQLTADNYPAAVEAGIRSLRANRSHASTLRLLAIAQALSGDVPGARGSVSELLALEPGFTRTAFFERFPGQPGVRTTRYADALGTAGLPDGDQAKRVRREEQSS